MLTFSRPRNLALATHRSASALDRGGISRRVAAGSRRSYDKPSSGPPACWLRLSVCTCAGRNADREDFEQRLRSPTTTLEPHGIQILRESSVPKASTTGITPQTSGRLVLILPSTSLPLSLKLRRPARLYNPQSD